MTKNKNLSEQISSYKKGITRGPNMLHFYSSMYHSFHSHMQTELCRTNTCKYPWSDEKERTYRMPGFGFNNM